MTHEYDIVTASGRRLSSYLTSISLSFTISIFIIYPISPRVWSKEIIARTCRIYVLELGFSNKIRKHNGYACSVSSFSLRRLIRLATYIGGHQQVQSDWQACKCGLNGSGNAQLLAASFVFLP